MTAQQMIQRSNLPWNRLGRIETHKWLMQDSEVQADDFDRLKSLGNCVMPACCRLALHLMGHHMAG